MVKNSLNVSSISEGFVLDHIEAGKSMEIYKYLNLDKMDCCVAIIKNASSKKMGSVETGLDHIFVLTDEENRVYRCQYCEEKYK